MCSLREGDYATWITADVYQQMNESVKTASNGTSMWELRTWTARSLQVNRSAYSWGAIDCPFIGASSSVTSTLRKRRACSVGGASHPRSVYRPMPSSCVTVFSPTPAASLSRASAIAAVRNSGVYRNLGPMGSPACDRASEPLCPLLEVHPLLHGQSGGFRHIPSGRQDGGASEDLRPRWITSRAWGRSLSGRGSGPFACL